MKEWPLLIALLYVVAMVLFTGPVVVLCWWPNGRNPGPEFAWIFMQWWYWAWVGLMFLGQWILLAVPVDLSDRRSVRRRPVIVPIAISGLMLAVLAVGALLALWEYTRQTGDFLGWPTLAIGAFAWAGWTLVFYLLSRRRDSTTVAAEQSSWTSPRMVDTQLRV